MLTNPLGHAILHPEKSPGTQRPRNRGLHQLFWKQRPPMKPPVEYEQFEVLERPNSEDKFARVAVLARAASQHRGRRKKASRSLRLPLPDRVSADGDKPRNSRFWSERIGIPFRAFSNSNAQGQTTAVLCLAFAHFFAYYPLCLWTQQSRTRAEESASPSVTVICAVRTARMARSLAVYAKFSEKHTPRR